MTYTDLLDAEIRMYGDYTRCLGIRKGTGGGEDHIDDMAQAWIDGKHDEVNAWVADREARLRAVKVVLHTKPVRNRRDRGRGIRTWGAFHPKTDRNRVLELRGQGWKLRDIAKAMSCSTSTVSRLCRSATWSATSSTMSESESSPDSTVTTIRTSSSSTTSRPSSASEPPSSSKTGRVST